MIVNEQCGDIGCDKFPVPPIDRQSKQVKNGDTENFICNQYREKLLF